MGPDLERKVSNNEGCLELQVSKNEEGVSNDGVSRTPGLEHGDTGLERQVSNNKGCLELMDSKNQDVLNKVVSRTPGLGHGDAGLERQVSNNVLFFGKAMKKCSLFDLHVGVRMPYFHEYGTLGTWVRCAWCMGTVRLVHGYGALDTWIYGTLGIWVRYVGTYKGCSVPKFHLAPESAAIVAPKTSANPKSGTCMCGYGYIGTWVHVVGTRTLVRRT